MSNSNIFGKQRKTTEQKEKQIEREKLNRSLNTRLSKTKGGKNAPLRRKIKGDKIDKSYKIKDELDKTKNSANKKFENKYLFDDKPIKDDFELPSRLRKKEIETFEPTTSLRKKSLTESEIIPIEPFEPIKIDNTPSTIKETSEFSKYLK